MFINPSIDDFKNYFVRDFPYGVEPAVVMDIDITNAMQIAGINFNPGFWSNQQEYSIGYLLLSAHYLVMNLRASSQGISGQYEWLQSGKGVGNVSETISIPDRILANPFWSMIVKTNYGALYLNLILPQLIAPIFSVCGRTNP